MKAYIVKRENGDLLDTVIRAHSVADAYVSIGGEAGCALREIPETAARAMGVPDEWNRYDGAVSRWIVGTTAVAGESVKK